MNLTATYSPADNKLRLYSVARLSPELYARVKAAGFSYAPQQELFVVPMWTPEREDLLLELCGEIDDEDATLVDRAEKRSERLPGTASIAQPMPSAHRKPSPRSPMESLSASRSW